MPAAPPGRFCWADVSAPDPDAGAYFYKRLFAWEAVALPIQTPAGIYLDYRQLRHAGRTVAGLYAQTGEEQSDGRPPRWLPFLSVPSADAAVARAAEHGARAVLPPTQVFSMGRMAVVADPEGAELGLWEPADAPGFELVDEPGAAGWFELWSARGAAASNFYRQLCGWGESTLDLGGAPYRMLLQEGLPVAGVRSAVGPLAELAPRWVPYFGTADVEATCRSLAELRGSVVVPPTEAPAGARYAVVRDRAGAPFGLLQR